VNSSGGEQSVKKSVNFFCEPCVLFLNLIYLQLSV